MADDNFPETVAVVTRAEAKALGLTRYFTGASCIHGHTAERLVSNRRCAACMKQAHEQWRRANPEMAAAAAARWVKLNPERARAARVKATANFAEKSRAKSRAWAKANRARAEERTRLWRENNPERAQASDVARAARRRAQVRSATRERVSPSDILDVLSRQKYRCAWCAAPIRNKWHIDHIEPLARGGQHTKSNLAGSCPSCNARKGAKDPLDWARETGKLL